MTFSLVFVGWNMFCDDKDPITGICLEMSFIN